MVRNQHFLSQWVFWENSYGRYAAIGCGFDVVETGIGLSSAKECKRRQVCWDFHITPTGMQAASNLWQDLKPKTIHNVTQKKLYWWRPVTTRHLTEWRTGFHTLYSCALMFTSLLCYIFLIPQYFCESKSKDLIFTAFLFWAVKEEICTLEVSSMFFHGFCYCISISEDERERLYKKWWLNLFAIILSHIWYSR